MMLEAYELDVVHLMLFLVVVVADVPVADVL